MRENEILESLKTREELIGRTEVLDKVKDLILLHNTEFATTEQVATYFNTSKDNIKKTKSRNNDELISDGVINSTYKEIKQLVNRDNVSPLKIPPRGTLLFTKRSILRMAMLLRDSDVAKEIRSRLLDIVQDVSEGKDDIIENVVNEIDEEVKLTQKLTKAILNGDLEEEGRIKTQIIGSRNKRIAELENKIDYITTNSLDIIESKNVINSLVRNIAVKEYNSMFGKTYSELYKKINYKLGINIKARTKKKSYLDTLTEKEMVEVEKIVKTWANDCKLNLSEILSLRKAI